MADIRTTISGIGGKYPSRVAGTPTGIQLNTFGLQKIRERIRGSQLAPILVNAMQPTKEQAVADWPRITGASGDSIRVEVEEEGSYYARVSLKAGGEQLINDPRNKSHKDYAPFIEFNGTSTTPPGTMTHAMITNEAQMKERIKEGVALLLLGE